MLEKMFKITTRKQPYFSNKILSLKRSKSRFVRAVYEEFGPYIPGVCTLSLTLYISVTVTRIKLNLRQRARHISFIDALQAAEEERSSHAVCVADSGSFVSCRNSGVTLNIIRKRVQDFASVLVGPDLILMLSAYIRNVY